MWQIENNIATFADPDFTGRIDLAFPGGGIVPHRSTGNLPATAHLLGARRLVWRPAEGVCEAPHALVECYARGVDLVATYAEAPEEEVRPQFYWRRIPRDPATGAHGFELIASLQTNLLDSRPLLEISGNWPVAGVTCGELPRGDDRQGPGSPNLSWQKRGADGSSPIVPAILAAWNSAGGASEAGNTAGAKQGKGKKGGGGSPVGSIAYVEAVPEGDLAEATWSPDPAGGIRVVWRLLAERLEKGVIRRARVRGMFFPGNPADERLREAIESWRRRWLAEPPPLAV